VHSELLLVIVVATALAFDFTNGFHDTANVVASAISTRALAPRTAIALASVLNFVGAFISLKVAATVATGIIDAGQVTETIVFAGLIGAIGWNLITWAYGLPSSSSHALIGGVIGAMLAAVGASGVNGTGVLTKVVIPAIVAPIAAFAVAGVAIIVIYSLFGRRRPGPVTRGFRLGQIVSKLGAGDRPRDQPNAQKTMGVITLALVAHGTLSANHATGPGVGRHHRRVGDLARHLRRRLADHPHGRQPDHQDGQRAGLRRPGRGGGGNPGLVALRLPPVLHARHLRRRDGRGRSQAAVSGALGRGRDDSPSPGWSPLPAAGLFGAAAYAVVGRLWQRRRGTAADVSGPRSGRWRRTARGPPPSNDGGGRERLTRAWWAQPPVGVEAGPGSGA